jgi:hypothetical protein
VARVAEVVPIRSESETAVRCLVLLSSGQYSCSLPDPEGFLRYVTGELEEVGPHATIEVPGTDGMTVYARHVVGVQRLDL